MPRARSIDRFDDAMPPARGAGRDAPARACGSDGAAVAASAASKPADRLCANMSPPATSGAILERLDAERAWSGYRGSGSHDGAKASVRYATQGARAVARRDGGNRDRRSVDDARPGTFRRLAPAHLALQIPIYPRSVSGGTEPSGRNAPSNPCGRPQRQSCVGSSRLRMMR
jgi:hypothetical protein